MTPDQRARYPEWLVAPAVEALYRRERPRGGPIPESDLPEWRADVVAVLDAVFAARPSGEADSPRVALVEPIGAVFPKTDEYEGRLLWPLRVAANETMVPVFVELVVPD